MNIFLDRTDGEPLYLQIRNQIRRLILSGSLPAGTVCRPNAGWPVNWVPTAAW